jgi:hypothetical protein
MNHITAPFFRPALPDDEIEERGDRRACATRTTAASYRDRGKTVA